MFFRLFILQSNEAGVGEPFAFRNAQPLKNSRIPRGPFFDSGLKAGGRCGGKARLSKDPLDAAAQLQLPLTRNLVVKDSPFLIPPMRSV